MSPKNIEPQTPGCNRFVLVVESNVRNQRFLSALLTCFTYDVRVVGTAEEALNIAAAIEPVLVVVARQLDADNDALGFIRTFRSVIPFGKAPIVVLTAKPDPAYERDCLNAGALTCLRAPITFENFYRVVQVAIEPIPRMTIRISVDVPAAINGQRTNDRVLEISEGGAYIQTDKLYPRDTKLELWIKLPDGVVGASAVVIYAMGPDKDAKGRSGMGLQFVQITPEHQQRIRLFIRREMAKGIEPPPPPA